jgi:hypothetical protein
LRAGSGCGWMTTKRKSKRRRGTHTCLLYCRSRRIDVWSTHGELRRKPDVLNDALGAFARKIHEMAVSVFVSVSVTRLGLSSPARARPVTVRQSLRPELICLECEKTRSQRGGRRFDPGLVHQNPWKNPADAWINQRTQCLSVSM